MKKLDYNSFWLGWGSRFEVRLKLPSLRDVENRSSKLQIGSTTERKHSQETNMTGYQYVFSSFLGKTNEKVRIGKCSQAYQQKPLTCPGIGRTPPYPGVERWRAQKCYDRMGCRGCG